MTEIKEQETPMEEKQDNLFRDLSKQLLKDLSKHSREIAINSRNIRLSVFRHKKQDEVLTEMASLLKVIKSHAKKIECCNKKIDQMEETLYCLYSNIKSNQFLHASEVKHEA